MFSGDFTTRLRYSIGIDGLISLLIGLAILFNPNRSAILATQMVAIGFVLTGLFHGALTFNKDIENNWARLANLVMAVIYLVAGVFMFVDAAIAAKYLFVFVSVFVGITWLLEGLLGLSYLNNSASRGWTMVVSVISIVAGIIILSSPLRSAEMLWQLLGIMLTVIGMFKITFFFVSR